MPIYKSTMIKYIKSFSTWIPLIVSIIVVLGIGVIMPFVLIDLKRPDIASTYQVYAIVSVSTIASSLTLFSATFAAYKTSQIYKQEIEEGTFLVLISKPISRRRIIFEKWLALITILIGYTAIIIIFYDVFIIIFDPGYKINNLNMKPISENIFIIGLILFFVILMLTILFSSISLLISSRFSSASTIATVAGLGALIPISGVLPTFTLNNNYIVVSKNPGSSLVGKNPSKETTNILNDLPTLSNDQKFFPDDIKNVFDELNQTAKTINSSQKYVNNIALSSGETNVYQSIFFLDFYYQLNQISSIASNKLWENVDKFSLVNSSNSSYASRPDVIGKKVVVDNDIEIDQMINRIEETINLYKEIIISKNYLQNFYNIFNLILKINNIRGATSVNDETSYKINLILLLASFWNGKNFNQSMFNSFISSPVLFSIQNSNIVDANIKNEINNRNKPYKNEIRNLELIFLLKILYDFKMMNTLLFSSFEINNYFLKNQYKLFTVSSNSNGFYELDEYGKKYFNDLMNNKNFKNLIDKYFSFSLVNNRFKITYYNYRSIVDILNLFNLKSNYNVNLKSIKYEPYVQTWILILIYLTIAIFLVPLSYFVIKRQNVR